MVQGRSRWVLVAMFGYNLQGMASDDMKRVIAAAETAENGNLVVTALRLSVTQPGRNEKCVCTPRTNKKYKHCCGSPSARGLVIGEAVV